VSGEGLAGTNQEPKKMIVQNSRTLKSNVLKKFGGEKKKKYDVANGTAIMQDIVTHPISAEDFTAISISLNEYPKRSDTRGTSVSEK
jgi:hypothetical protein